MRFHGRTGRGVRRIPGTMNRLELAYSELLKERVREGEVLWWAFDTVKFRLAGSTFYTPDFMVMLADGTVEVHEVKGGFIEDDAMVKLKVAADKFPFRFLMAQKKRVKEPWIVKEYGT